MKALITGISGFAGSHLAEHLVSHGRYQIFGTYLSDSSLTNLQKIRSDVALTRLDLMDYEKVANYIALQKPDIIFHLATISSLPDSFENPTETIMNNVSSQVNVLEAVKNAKLMQTTILIVSSSEVYGNVDKKDLPIDEEEKVKPINPYAVSKLTQDMLGQQYYLTYKLQTIRVRPFNHIGPRQSPNFVVSAFAKKIAEIEKTGKEGVLSVGNVTTKRDFTDVRDVVVAYRLVIEKGNVGEVYNIGSGKSHKIEDILAFLLSRSKVKIRIKKDPKLMRPSDALDFVCDNHKITTQTGWKPKIPFEKTLVDTLEYWRNII